jgi:hypothetical protein
MNLAKLILLACPAFLASLLMLANPAHALSITSQHVTQITTVASVQSNHDVTMPMLATRSNPIMDQLNCSCSQCVKSKFQLLQGKLPSANFA